MFPLNLSPQAFLSSCRFTNDFTFETGTEMQWEEIQRWAICNLSLCQGPEDNLNIQKYKHTLGLKLTFWQIVLTRRIVYNSDIFQDIKNCVPLISGDKLNYIENLKYFIMSNNMGKTHKCALEPNAIDQTMLMLGGYCVYGTMLM